MQTVEQKEDVLRPDGEQVPDPAQARRAIAEVARRGQYGMTLTEILIVIAILGMLTAAITFGVMKFFRGGQESTAKQHLSTLQTALKNYAAAHGGKYPDDLSGMVEKKYLKKRQLKDPWGHLVRYTKPEGTGDPKVCSNGPDGQPDTDDDLCDPPKDEDGE